MTCQHDQTKFGLFGLPKEARGCLACAYEHRVAEIERLRGLLRDGIVFVVNCSLDPEQPQEFKNKAHAWNRAAMAAIEGATVQPRPMTGDERGMAERAFAASVTVVDEGATGQPSPQEPAP